MGKKRTSRQTKQTSVALPGYDHVLADIVGLLEAARRASARTVNVVDDRHVLGSRPANRGARAGWRSARRIWEGIDRKPLGRPNGPIWAWLLHAEPGADAAVLHCVADYADGVCAIPLK